MTQGGVCWDWGVSSVLIVGDIRDFASQHFAGGGKRPNKFSSASPMLINFRSLPAGPSSSSPTGRLLDTPRPIGTCKPGRPALLPGSVF